jgi:tungstate transport system substrate-binding protein
VILATTTSVGNSGLLDAVLPAYNGSVRPLLVGSGRAIEMLAAGQADVIISHAPEREEQALRAHPDWWYRKILFNDFLIVGPADDPARVAAARTGVEAMRLIAGSSAIFLSRGDQSGTHERELALWRAAGATPDPKRLVVAGAGMGQTLRVASGTGAYVLTDRGTFESLRESMALKPLFEGDPALLNTYAVIADPKRPPGVAFAQWITSAEGRGVLEGALSQGRIKGFTLWPAGAAADTPGATPLR